MLLQVLDDGRITDSQGRTVDFKNTVLILTSNLGSEYLLDGIDENGEISEEAKTQVFALLKQSFRPEFLNRLDEIVCYKPLTKTDISAILDLQMAKLNARLADSQLTCRLNDSARAFIIQNGYDPMYGARPLKRYLQRHLETQIAKELLQDEIPSDGKLLADVQDEKLVVVPEDGTKSFGS